MAIFRQAQVASLRAAALLVTVAVAWWATGLPRDGIVLRSILLGYGAFYVVGSVLAARRYTAHAVLLLLLLGDLLAIGSVGCWLHRGFEPQVAFLAGYLVAVLVAVVGRSVTAAVLGSMAGAMTMGLTATLFSTLRHESPDLWALASQLALLVCGAVLASRITGALERDAQQRAMSERLEQAMREREAEAAEIVTFTQALAESSSLHHLVEATVRHLRVHMTVRARAIALESKGETVALWEEAGRLTEDQVERRRTLLQESLAKAGNDAEIRKLEARSTGGRPLPQALDFYTVVEVPIRTAGRVSGVLFLGDPRRGVLPEYRIGVVADIARRVGQAVQQLEQRSVEEHRRTALLLRQMRDGVMLLAADGRVLLANPAARKALGCVQPDEPFPAAVGEVSLAELAQTPAGVSRRFRVRLQHEADHPSVQLACTAIGILDGGTRLGTLVTLSDVTDEEQARSRLVLSEKLSLVGQTLAGVAHELNNPLTALIGYAELLRSQEVPPHLEKTLKKIQEQAVRSTRIVKNLLSVARQRNPERNLVDTGEILASVVELFAYEARVSNVSLELEVAPELPKILGDPHALQQIFVNLVQNAIHALKEHDGQRLIRVEAHPHPDSLHIVVSDSGPGIPEDLRTRIFQAFFTTKGPEKGTGLGLALSRSIARDHGGDLILDEAAMGGARFVVRLPLPRAVVGDAAALPTLGVSLGLKVLVVDDENDVREAVVAQLGRIGCQVTSTSTAAEAKRIIDQGEFDAVLTDIRMPGTSGLELYQFVHARNEQKARGFVFMSGDYANEDVYREVHDTGQPILEKPFTTDELVDVLRRSTHLSEEARHVAPPRASGTRRQAQAPVIEHADAEEALGRILRLD